MPHDPLALLGGVMVPPFGAAVISAFATCGLQVAAGTPLACDEAADFKTFRIGLFGLDKLRDVDGTVQRLDDALARIVV